MEKQISLISNTKRFLLSKNSTLLKLQSCFLRLKVHERIAVLLFQHKNKKQQRVERKLSIEKQQKWN